MPQKQKVAEILIRNVNKPVPVYKIFEYSWAYRYGAWIHELRKEWYDIRNIMFWSGAKKKTLSFYMLCTDADKCAAEAEKVRHKFL